MGLFPPVHTPSPPLPHVTLRPHKVSDLDLDDDGHAWVGFTGTSGPASAMSIWISDWSVGAPKTDASRSRLREDGEVIGRAFARGSVHLDARDSCGMPRTVGGDTWQVSVTWMGAEVGHDGIEDLGDGSYRVTVGPSWWGGEFRLTARLVEPSGPSTAVVEGSFIRNAGA